jgi:hypothetical protein
MLFREKFRNWRLNRECLQFFKKHPEQFNAWDLPYPEYYFTDEFQPPASDQTARHVGVFCTPLLGGLSPQQYFTIKWMVRRDGIIWPQWIVTVGSGSYLYNQEYQWGNLGPLPHPQAIQYASIFVPMSKKSLAVIVPYTKEQWVMHKLTSESLI